MTRFLGGWIAVAALAATTAVASAQTTPAKPEDKPKTLAEELVFFGYVENSYVWNLSSAGNPQVNELRFYDFDTGYTFNLAEISIKKDPSDRYPFGFGLVLTGGQDAQKNHAIGLFRNEDEVFPFDDSPHVDVQEIYGSYKIPVGTGLTIKAGKFVTLLGYEVIEGPNNLNFSRSFLFGFAIPLTHVGALLSYSITDWLTVTAGPVAGWDVANDINDHVSWMGQVLIAPFKDFTTSFNFITGPEQFSKDHNRTVLDFVANYTGIKGLTLGFNVDYGFEENEASLRGAGARDTDAAWWGVAAYAAYDWTDKLRTALRGEYFEDTDGVRTLALGPGSKVSLWEATATVTYNIWKGLFSRVEYRHDHANEKVFRVRSSSGGPTSRSQDTLTLALHYLFF